MAKSNISRREVVKVLGASGTLSTVGAGMAIAETGDEVRLLEVGLKYSLPDREDYHKYFTEGTSKYSVNPRKETVTLFRTLRSETRSRIKESSVVVAGQDKFLTSTGTLVEGGKRNSLPTGLNLKNQPNEFLYLSSDHKQPPIRATITDKEVSVTVNGHTLKPTQSEVYELPKKEVHGETVTVTDEHAEIEGVPEHQLGPKQTFNSVKLTVAPKLVIEDHGTLSIKEYIDKNWP